MKLTLSRDIDCLMARPLPIIVMETARENAALDLLLRSSRDHHQRLWRWSVTDGLELLGFGPRVVGTGKPLDAEALLEHIKQSNESGIYALCDFHPYLQDAPRVVRLLKDIALDFERCEKRVVLLSYRLDMPPELHVFSAAASLRLPDDDEILAIVRKQARRYAERRGQQRVSTDGRALKQMVQGLRGLTREEIEPLAYDCIANDGAITRDDIPGLRQARFELLKEHGLLEWIMAREPLDELGGLNNLKAWLQNRRSAFAQSAEHWVPVPKGQVTAEALRQDCPRGVLLVGVQGAGKSLAAKVIAGSWHLPLLRLDMGSLYNKFIGETEKNLRDTLAQAEQLAPAVLWLDEIEKALSSGSGDEGLGRRLLGYLLTWMAERQAPVFLVATSNDISALPAELVRKGRFDEIFFVDLPEQEEREQILIIHLRKRQVALDDIDCTRLAIAAEGFSGAELEQVVVSALYQKAENQPMTTTLLLSAIQATSPLSSVMAEQVQMMREWAQGRTRLA